MSTMLGEVMSRFNEDYEPEINYGSYQISAKVNTDQYSRLSALVDLEIVDNKTDALRLLIEAGFIYMTHNLPDPIGEVLQERKAEILEILREHEENQC